jgi:prevent-host-death family protein
METQSDSLTNGDDVLESPVVREMVELPGLGKSVSVRAAKAHLSGLLDLVAAGQEVVVTSGGKPKARIVPMTAKPARKPFGSTREHRKKIPWRGGPDATQLIREDRDSRGW